MTTIPSIGEINKVSDRMKIGGHEITQCLMKAMKTERGVHIESLLCALGALAGYSCQASVRAQAIAAGLSEEAMLIVAETNDGKRFFMGDPLNLALAESEYSIWALAAGEAQSAGCTALPDVSAIYKHAVQTMGSSEFGIPRIPKENRPGDLPVNYLNSLWRHIYPIAITHCEMAAELPVVFGNAVQEAIDIGKSVVAPRLALEIVMESAIPMSKVELQNGA